MRPLVVLAAIGQLVRPFCLAFIPPLLLALRDGLFDASGQGQVAARELLEAGHFTIAALMTFALGWFLSGLVRVPRVLRRSEALGIVTGTWAIVAACAAIPYLANGMSPVDAYFEAVSGLTTTGATVLTEWDQTRAFFFWRSMTQWFGGLGVIALFVVVLPRLGIAGRQIFFAEASTAPGEAVSPSVRQSARKLWILYTGLTLLMAVLLVCTGRSLYEGVVHSLTTLAAGGFSPNPRSIEGYRSPAMEWVMVPFMVIAGASYPLMWNALRRGPRTLSRDGEFRLYFGTVLVATGAIAVLLAGRAMPAETHLRAAAFQVASLISSSGFASTDYALWGDGAKLLLLVVMITGGCAGSAAGGAKQVRFLLVFKFLKRELTRVLHPRAVLPMRYGGEEVPNPVMWAVFTLVTLYLAGYGVFMLPTVLIDGVDLATGFSAAVACLSNVGPGFGPLGPMGSYAELHWFSRLSLTAAMLIGRLEIVTALALLHPHVWRSLTLGGVPDGPEIAAGD